MCQGTAARGILVAVDFSPVLLGPSFKSQRCRGLVQRRASVLVETPASCGHLRGQPPLSHGQDTSLGLCRGLAEGSVLVDELLEDIAFPTIPLACLALGFLLIPIFPVCGELPS